MIVILASRRVNIYDSLKWGYLPPLVMIGEHQRISGILSSQLGGCSPGSRTYAGMKALLNLNFTVFMFWCLPLWRGKSIC
jgi:hypothetical protein